MIVVGTCFAGDGTRYRECAEPTLEQFRAAGDVVLAASGDRRGIAAVYNEFIDAARARLDCEALVLVQDDVEILDAQARAKILTAVASDTVGLVGVVGARDVRSLAWWEGVGVGAVLESRGPITHEEREGIVDAVDGLLLILGRGAFSRLRFDEQAFPRFHAYDVDMAFQVRDLGLEVRVIALDAFHRTRGGLGDEKAFFAADRALFAKWMGRVPGLTQAARTVGPIGEVRRAVLRWLRRRGQSVRDRRRLLAGVGRRSRDAVLDTVRRLRAGLLVRRVGTMPACGACGAEVDLRPLRTVPGAVPCGDCGTGITWPPPMQDPTTSRIWEGQYGGRRAERAAVWEREAVLRVQWLAQHLPAGRVLDVGAATGEFVQAAAAAGFEVEGIDGEQRDLGDAIMLWHVANHVPDPAGLLRDIRERSRTGTLVLLEVPNFSSSEAERLQRRWHHLQLDEHVTHFTPTGLERLLTRAGLVVVNIEELSERTYLKERAWRRQWNEALAARRPWPSLDLLRAVARVPG